MMTCINAPLIAVVLIVNILLHWFAERLDLLKYIYYTEKKYSPKISEAIYLGLKKLNCSVLWGLFFTYCTPSTVRGSPHHPGALSAFLPPDFTQMAISGVIRCSSALLWSAYLNKPVLCLIWYQLKAFWMEAFPHPRGTCPPNSWQCLSPMEPGGSWGLAGATRPCLICTTWISNLCQQPEFF